MKEILIKWIEYKKYKLDLLYCRHHFVEKERWLNTSEYIFNGAKNSFTIIHYFCDKCGEFKKVDSRP